MRKLRPVRFWIAALVLLSGMAHAGESAKLAIGADVPDFKIADLDGAERSWRELQGEAKRPLVLVFWCTYCGSCRQFEADIAKLAKTYQAQAAIYALDANADDSAADVKRFLEHRKDLSLPVLLDPGAKVADLFRIATTTTAIVIDGDGKLRYRGRLHAGAQKAYTENALKALLNKQIVDPSETPEGGCSIVRKR
ncbi:MAG: hypothetical protein AMXMBFR7_34090 [Planctomycetota bacterium]